MNSLLANDAYGFLVRRALDSGLKLKDFDVKLVDLRERRKQLASDGGETQAQRDANLLKQRDAVKKLQLSYNRMIENIRTTYSHFSAQQYSDAVRITMQASTSSGFTQLLMNAFTGVAVGLAAGVGLSLLGINVAGGRRS